MISGKSIAMIRAACSITAGSAAVSLGHETRPHSVKSPPPTHRRHFIPAAPASSDNRPASPTTRPASSASAQPASEDWNSFSALPPPTDADRLETFNNAVQTIYDNNGAAAVGGGGGNGAGAVAVTDSSSSEDAAVESPSVLSSIKYWAQLFKTFNGMYGGSSSAGTGSSGVEMGAGSCEALACEEDGVKKEDEEVEAAPPSEVLAPRQCRFCQSVPNFVPSPTSLKNTTLNTVTASRHLFLVRHGQYHNTRKMERDRCLTRVGREQLRLTGDRLREIGASYNRIVASTMKRAQESAEIILKCIGRSDLPFGSDPLLEEGAPIVPEPPLPNWKPNKKQYQTDGERIETAFRKYFRKADISQSSDINEIIVCHANVIRYFVCRALEVQPEAWLRMWLNHGSITWLTIKPSGRVVLNAMGASGYMPPSRLTAT